MPPNSRGEAEVQTDGFGVADVEIAVGLRGEPGLHAAAVLVGPQIVENDVADEVGAWSAAPGLIRRSVSDEDGFILI